MLKFLRICLRNSALVAIFIFSLVSGVQAQENEILTSYATKKGPCGSGERAG